MNLGDMTKNELEEFGRTVGIELDRRLNKADLLEQLIEHLQTVDETAEDDGVELDFIKPEEEWSEKDISHPLMPEVPEEVAVEVDPEIAIQAERDARRYCDTTKEAVIQAQVVYDALKKRRIESEVAEVESAEALDAAKDIAVKAELDWNKLASSLAETL
jgi:hypothetical protein